MNTVLERLPNSNLPIAKARPRRLLLIAYNFPPVGGAGVQRPVKWVKYLRQFGWDVTVLTTENPSVPTRDESLLADIPDDVLVVRTRTLEPDYRTKQGLVGKSANPSQGLIGRFKSAVGGLIKRVVKLVLQPDPQVLWVPGAIKAGRRLLCEFEHDVILVTAPAYSSFFIGTALKRRFGLPLVLDYRDEWDLSGKYLENAHRDGFSRVIQERMQCRLLKQADAVVATTNASTANLAEKLKSLNRASIPAVTVYNGFDTDEFQTCSNGQSARAVFNPLSVAVAPRSVSSNGALAKSCEADAGPIKRYRLLYAGTLWNLTSIEPLVEAICRLNQTAPDLLQRLELVCVGRKTAEQTAIVERVKRTGCELKLVDYCDHSKILDWMQSADAVCLLLSDVPGAERVVPAKLFEYLATLKEMLAIVPQGETAQIVQRFYPSGAIDPKNIDTIVQWLKNRLTSESRAALPMTDESGIDEYSRATQTRRLVNLLCQLVLNRPQH